MRRDSSVQAGNESFEEIALKNQMILESLTIFNLICLFRCLSISHVPFLLNFRFCEDFIASRVFSFKPEFARFQIQSVLCEFLSSFDTYKRKTNIIPLLNPVEDG
jgi:hypothetical protein